MTKKDLKEALEPNKTQREHIYYRTGCTMLDVLVGGGLGLGIPGGAIINIIGDKSSGKSFIKNEILAANYHHFGKQFVWYSDDTESGDTFDTTALYGVNLRPEDRKVGNVEGPDSSTVEELDAKLSIFIDGVGENQPAIYAVDSLDGLQSAEQVTMAQSRAKQYEKGEEVKDSGSYAMALQKFLSQHLFRDKHKKFSQKQAVLIIVSQIRDKIDAMGYGDQYEVSGGKALEFYGHTRLMLKTVHKIQKKGTVIGLVVEARLIKSKTPRPFRKARFIVYFDYGIDDIGSSIDYLYDLRDETGKLLLDKCNKLRWGGNSSPPTLAELTKWLTDNGFLDRVKTYHKEKGKGGAIQAAVAMEAIDANQDMQAAYIATYGKQISRGELINLCEANKEEKSKLDKAVIAAWEENEKELASGRGKKYG